MNFFRATLVSICISVTFGTISANAKVMESGAIMPDIQQAPRTTSLAYANPLPFEFNVFLPSLFDRERQEIDAVQLGGRQKIGIHRDVPSSRSGDLSKKLTWKKDGTSVVAYMRVHSPEAKGIRFSAMLELPAGATVTFYAQDPKGSVKTIHSFTTDNKGLKENEYWSPAAPGESIGIEIRLTKPSQTKDVSFKLITVAHRFELPVNTGITLNALECTNHVEIQCAIDDGNISEDVASSTMLLWFESEGSSYACSGTLMNVSGDDGYIPYVLTAAHCISTRDAAQTVIADWNYQTKGCIGEGTSANWRRTYGGADLLATEEQYDQTLLRLNEDPPAGVSFSGWWVTDVKNNVKVLGASHPAGEPKKFFSGKTIPAFYVRVCDEDDNCFTLTDPIGVEMTEGTIEGGSSGSGLRTVYPDDGENYLVGVLSASNSECENTEGFYGAFENFYPYIRTWFDDLGQPDGDDHGDTKASATLIDQSSVTEASIHATGSGADPDVDYFKIEVTYTGKIKVYATAEKLAFLDGDIESADGEIEVEEDFDWDTEFTLTADVTPGIYYIKVEASSAWSEGDYTLHVEPDAPDDHGDYQESATTVASNGLIWTYLTPAYIEFYFDKDVFEISLEHESRVTIYTEGKTDTQGTLTTDEEVELLSNEDATEEDANFRLTGKLDEGTYLLIVEGSIVEKSEYQLVIDIVGEIDEDNLEN